MSQSSQGHRKRMSARDFRSLDAGYTADVDAIDEESWCKALLELDDANIYQTWPYGAVISGESNNSHFVLRRGATIVALAQVRIARLPVVRAGVAYVRWGPLWRRDGREDSRIF